MHRDSPTLPALVVSSQWHEELLGLETSRMHWMTRTCTCHVHALTHPTALANTAFTTVGSLSELIPSLHRKSVSACSGATPPPPPTNQPTSQPTSQPASQPASQPTNQPTNLYFANGLEPIDCPRPCLAGLLKPLPGDSSFCMPTAHGTTVRAE